jgi:2-polyprenyl-6-methoxyphenol hydroxylase-like FAD-dependent oxidoreductase
MYFELDDDEVQAGYYVPKGTYSDLREAGIEAFRERLLAVDPRLEPVFPEGLGGFEETSLLHIEPGIADEWVRDGLALIGDAAHVASPFGGRGNPAAVRDAAALRPHVVDALRERPGDDPLPAERLRPYADRRRASVETILAAQRREEAALSWFVRNHDRYRPRCSAR